MRRWKSMLLQADVRTSDATTSDITTSDITTSGVRTSAGRNSKPVARRSGYWAERAYEVEALLKAFTALRRDGMLTDAEFELKRQHLATLR